MAYKALRSAQRMAFNYAEDLYDDLESWKKDHGNAMRCRDLEERLALLNGAPRARTQFQGTLRFHRVVGRTCLHLGIRRRRIVALRDNTSGCQPLAE